MSYAEFLASKAIRAQERVALPPWLKSGPAEPLAVDSYRWNGKRAFIYGLVDPRTNEIRYIGKTQQSPSTRLRAHMLDRSNCHRVHWLRELAALGLEPDIVLLEAIEGAWPWQESERYWIAKYRNEGARLLNLTDGGEGLAGLPMSQSHKDKIAAALRTGGNFHCEKCGMGFWRRRSDILAGHNKFCSRTCSNARHKA